MKTIRDIEYRPFPYLKTFLIPEGTKVERASNLPGYSYWALPWEGMDQDHREWLDSYGFHVDREDVREEVYSCKVPAILWDDWGFFESRGYLPPIPFEAIEGDPEDADFVGESGHPVTLSFTEPEAWDIQEWIEDAGEAFGACVAPGLLDGFLRMMGEIA